MSQSNNCLVLWFQDPGKLLERLGIHLTGTFASSFALEVRVEYVNLVNGIKGKNKQWETWVTENKAMNHGY